MRVGLSLVCGALIAAAFGDDDFESHPRGRHRKEIQSCYEAVGMPLKHFERADGMMFSFCSVAFGPDGKREPETWAKTYFRLASAKPEMARLVQWQQEMRHSPRRNELEETLEACGWVDAALERLTVQGPRSQNDRKEQDEEE